MVCCGSVVAACAQAADAAEATQELRGHYEALLLAANKGELGQVQHWNLNATST